MWGSPSKACSANSGISRGIIVGNRGVPQTAVASPVATAASTEAATAVLAAAVADMIETLPVPHPDEIPGLLRRLGRLLGKVLGVDFVLKLAACGIASDNVAEFRQRVRHLVLLEL